MKNLVLTTKHIYDLEFKQLAAFRRLCVFLMKLEVIEHIEFVRDAQQGRVGFNWNKDML